MKKSFLIVCISFLTIQVVNAQTIDLPKTKSTAALYDSYIKKYKTNKTIGRVLLYSGIGMIIGGGAVFASYAHQGFNGPAPVTGEAIFFIIGPGAALASIPFFISAKHSKTKAELVIKGESVGLMNKISCKSNYTVIALTINF